MKGGIFTVHPVSKGASFLIKASTVEGDLAKQEPHKPFCDLGMLNAMEAKYIYSAFLVKQLDTNVLDTAFRL